MGPLLWPLFGIRGLRWLSESRPKLLFGSITPKLIIINKCLSISKGSPPDHIPFAHRLLLLVPVILMLALPAIVALQSGMRPGRAQQYKSEYLSATLLAKSPVA